MSLNRLWYYANGALRYASKCRFLNDSRAVTAIEYAMIAAIMAVAVVGSVTSMGPHLAGMFSTVSAEL
jgi:pilus assembly protein Flp/PilA